MAQNNGVSVLGAQRVIGSEQNTGYTIEMAIDHFATALPVVVGYYYVFVEDDNGQNGRICFRDLLYEDGFVIPSAYARFPGYKRFTVLVNWNESGRTWNTRWNL